VYIKVGQCLLQEQLEYHNMQAIELSLRTGISKTQLSGYMNNSRCMSLKTAKIISFVLHCQIEDLYQFTIR
jgi:DNA-binding Xre family transcriptional regulator